MFGKRHASHSGRSAKTPSSETPAPETGSGAGAADPPGPLRTPPLRPFRRSGEAQRTVEAATVYSAQPSQPARPSTPQASAPAAQPPAGGAPSKPSAGPAISDHAAPGHAGAGRASEPDIPAPAEPEPAAKVSPGTPPSAGRSLVVGREIELRGAVKSCERLIVEGRVEGEVSETEALEIGPEGFFSGTAEVERCTIAGRLEGELTVTGLLRLESGAVLQGKLRYGELEIARGGRMAGDIDEVQASAGRGDAAAGKAESAKSAEPKPSESKSAEAKTRGAKQAGVRSDKEKTAADSELALGRT